MIMLLAHAEVSRSCLEPNLRYVTKEDLDSNDVKEIAEEERVGIPLMLMLKTFEVRLIKFAATKIFINFVYLPLSEQF